MKRRARAAPSTKPAPAAPPSPWVLDRARDLGLLVGAPLWILPALFLVAGAVGDRAVNTWVMALGSIGHHLPGMLRAYGDRALFRRFRTRFLLAPAALAALCIGFDANGLHAIVFIAFAWGVWHGMMQTYGFARIYAAKSGASDAWSARLDFALLAAWFAAGVLLSPYRVTFLIDTGAQCGLPFPSETLVHALRWMAIAAAAAASAAWLAGAALAWRAGRRPSPARLLLIAGSIAFWWFANVRVRHPLLGMPLFEVFHDVQYLAIVWAFNRRRADASGKELAPSLRALFRPTWGAVAAYVVAVAAYGALGLVQPEGTFGGVWNGLLAASQLLHFYYDGFIWKVRERDTGAALGVAQAGAAPSVRRVNLLGWGALAAAALLLGIGEARGVPSVAERVLALQRLVPDNGLVQFAAAELRWKAGEGAAALDGFRRALALDPDDAVARRNLALSLGDLAEAAARAGDGATLRADLDELRRLRPGLNEEDGAWADRTLARLGGGP